MKREWYLRPLCDHCEAFAKAGPSASCSDAPSAVAATRQPSAATRARARAPSAGGTSRIAPPRHAQHSCARRVRSAAGSARHAGAASGVHVSRKARGPSRHAAPKASHHPKWHGSCARRAAALWLFVAVGPVAVPLLGGGPGCHGLRPDWSLKCSHGSSSTVYLPQAARACSKPRTQRRATGRPRRRERLCRCLAAGGGWRVGARCGEGRTIGTSRAAARSSTT